MTQEEFFKKFCPDYEKKLKEQVPPQEHLLTSIFLVQQFYWTVFEESLQVFSDKLCEEQRKICVNDAKCRYNNDIFQSRTTSISSLVDSILNSPTPNLSDL